MFDGYGFIVNGFCGVLDGNGFDGGVFEWNGLGLDWFCVNEFDWNGFDGNVYDGGWVWCIYC